MTAVFFPAALLLFLYFFTSLHFAHLDLKCRAVGCRVMHDAGNVILTFSWLTVLIPMSVRPICLSPCDPCDEKLKTSVVS